MHHLISGEGKWVSVVAIGASALCLLQIAYFIKSTFILAKKNVTDVPQKCKKEDGYKEPVITYLFNGNGPTISGSPFSAKLAMYLRLAGIPHVVKEADFEKAPKSKVPYIEHAGSFFGDSQLIIRYMENTFDVSKMATKSSVKGTKAFVPFDSLSEENQGLSDMIRYACETELYWALSSVRWAGDQGIGKSESLWETTRAMYFDKIPAFIRGIITNMIRVNLMRDAWGYGLVRHSPNDQLFLATRSLKSLSSILGKKAYFLGDFPAECDCTAFGALECVLDDSCWPNDLTTYMRTECPNLVQYVQRVRQQVFPDVAPTDLRPSSRDTGLVPLPKK